MTNNSSPSSRGHEGSAAKGSTKKSIAILLIGVVAAVALAVFFFRSAEEGQPGTNLTLRNPATVQADTLRVKGPEDAVVTLVEYGDYQCPTCGAFHPVVAELMDQFQTQLKLEYHHYPLTSIHPNALAAAIATEAAAEQGAFWEMHDLLFELQNQWATHSSPAQLFRLYAERLGLDGDLFDAAYQSGGAESRVMADMQHAQEMRLPGTPTFFVNGEMLPLPRSFAEFESAISTAIENAE